MNTLTKSPIFAVNYKKDYMKRTIFFVFFASLLVFNISAQNWDINTLHKINSWDGKFIRNYNKIISRTEPYIAVGVPVAMALAAWVKKDRELLKDAVYVGTSVAGAFVVTYGLKYLIDRERPFDRYPDRVHAYSHETFFSFRTYGNCFCIGNFTLCEVSEMVCNRSICLMGMFCRGIPYE